MSECVVQKCFGTVNVTAEVLCEKSCDEYTKNQTSGNIAIERKGTVVIDLCVHSNGSREMSCMLNGKNVEPVITLMPSHMVSKMYIFEVNKGDILVCNTSSSDGAWNRQTIKVVLI